MIFCLINVFYIQFTYSIYSIYLNLQLYLYNTNLDSFNIYIYIYIYINTCMGVLDHLTRVVWLENME